MTVKFKSLKVVFGRSNCLTLKQQTLAGLYFLSHLTLFDKLNCRDQWGGGGEEMGSGTEKRCSHNLQRGHPAWWSVDNYSIFPQ